MRTEVVTTQRGFQAKAISGTHVILIALNCPEALRTGLKGFSFEREVIGTDSRGPKFLRSQKVFRSIVPDPQERPGPKRLDQTASVLYGQFSGAELSLGRLFSVARDQVPIPHLAQVWRSGGAGNRFERRDPA